MKGCIALGNLFTIRSMAEATSTPNIILINCDDLGYGDLGCYGSDKNSTPVLDQMAAEGTRFTDFYMGSPVCSPSRGAMMTGCYPPRIGFSGFEQGWVLFPNAPDGLNPEETSIAKMLKGQGYSTMLVGKWHCGDQPEFLPSRHGFDHYYGLPYSNDMGRQMRHSGEMTNFPPLPLLQDDEVIQEQPDQAGLTERYVEKAVDFIRTNKENPFFLYFAHMYVHLPLYAPERFLKQSRNGRYGAAVECIDWATGVLLHELKRLGLDDNTLVLFTSDNGSRARDEGGSNLPLNGTKGTTWEGGMRLPLIARWPGKVPAGRVSDELLASIDLLPTFAGITGADLPEKPIDGLDCSEHLLGNSPETPRDTFYYYHTRCLCAVRHGDWKLHIFRHGDEPWKDKTDDASPVVELYNLRDDIGETTDVSGDHPEIVEKILGLASEARQELGDACERVEGQGVRSIGRVENPKPLTEFDENHPYIEAYYDLADAG